MNNFYRVQGEPMLDSLLLVSWYSDKAQRQIICMMKMMLMVMLMKKKKMMMRMMMTTAVVPVRKSKRLQSEYYG